MDTQLHNVADLQMQPKPDAEQTEAPESKVVATNNATEGVSGIQAIIVGPLTTTEPKSKRARTTTKPTAEPVAKKCKGKGKGKQKDGKKNAGPIAIMKKKKQCKKKIAVVKAKKPMKKPAKWLRMFPNGCSKCRYCKGCTPSCWKLHERKKK